MVLQPNPSEFCPRKVLPPAAQCERGRPGETRYLFLEETVEHEDEHPLQRVEDGEEVRHDDGGVVEEEEAKSPRQAQQAEECEGSQHPRPAGSKSTATA